MTVLRFRRLEVANIVRRLNQSCRRESGTFPGGLAVPKEDGKGCRIKDIRGRNQDTKKVFRTAAKRGDAIEDAILLLNIRVLAIFGGALAGPCSLVTHPSQQGRDFSFTAGLPILFSMVPESRRPWSEARGITRGQMYKLLISSPLIANCMENREVCRASLGGSVMI